MLAPFGPNLTVETSTLVASKVLVLSKATIVELSLRGLISGSRSPGFTITGTPESALAAFRSGSMTCGAVKISGKRPDAMLMSWTASSFVVSLICVDVNPYALRVWESDAGSP